MGTGVGKQYGGIVPGLQKHCSSPLISIQGLPLQRLLTGQLAAITINVVVDEVVVVGRRLDVVVVVVVVLATGAGIQ